MDEGILKGRRIHQQLKAKDMPTTDYLLVIGINDYENGLLTLNNAANDARAFEDLMKTKYGFRNEHIFSFYDDEATKDNILDAFDKLYDILTNDDNLVIYFSGHGEFHERTQRGYWVTYGSRSKKRGDFLIESEILDFMRGCKARHILGIADSCYAGSIFKKTSDRNLNAYYTKPSRHFMTAGLLEPVPDGHPKHHSPFAASLLSALQYNIEPYLSITALWNEVQSTLDLNTTTTPTTPTFEPLRNVGHQGGQYFFILANATVTPPIGNTSVPPSIEPEEKEEKPAANRKALEEFSKLKWSERDSDDLSPLSEIKDELSNLTTGDFEKAVEAIKSVINRKSRLNNDLILLQGRYNQIKRDWNLSLVSNDDYYRTINQIRYAMNQLIKDLREEDLQ